MNIDIYKMIIDNYSQFGNLQYKNNMNQTQQNILQMINILCQLQIPQYAKQLQSIINKQTQSIQLFNLIKYIINNLNQYNLNHNTYNNINKNSMIIINRILQKQFLSKNIKFTFEQIIIYFIQELINWKHSYNHKKLLYNSILKSIQIWQKQIDDLFQKLTELLILMIEQSSITFSIGLTSIQQFLIHQNINHTFQITITSQDYKQVYHTIIFIYQILFQRLELKTGQYQLNIIQNFKKLHQILFQQHHIKKYFQVFVHLFKCWDIINNTGLDLKKSMTPFYLYLCDWSALPTQISLIISFNSPLFDPDNNIYNYTKLTQNWRDRQLLSLKSLALNTITGLVLISQIIYQPSIQFTKTQLSINYKQIINSIIYSLKYHLSNKQNLQLFQQLTINMLQSFSVYAQTFKKQINNLHIIFFDILLPIINIELQLLNNLQDQQEILKYLNNCCFEEQINQYLPLVFKIIQTIGDQYPQFIYQIRNYALYSLKYMLRLSINIPGQQLLTNYKPCNISCSFIILTIINHFKDMSTPLIQMICHLLQDNIFENLDIIDKRYCYYYLSWSIILITQQQKQYFNIFIQKQLNNIKLDPFYIDFIDSIRQDQYNLIFIQSFFHSFISIHSSQTKWIIIDKIIKNNINNIQQSIILYLISTFKLQIQKQIQQAHQKIQLHQKYHVPYKYLFICIQIAKKHSYIIDKPLIVKQLYSISLLADHLSTLQIQDAAINIAGQLLQCFKTLPQNFNILLQVIGNSFRNVQFRGYCYSYFFGQAIEIIGLNQNQQLMNIYIDKLYNILIQAFAYLVQFPDGLTDTQYQDITTQQYLLQNLFLQVGDKLNIKYIKQTIQQCKYIYIKIQDTNQKIIKTRTLNLQLICQILYLKQYQFQEIYNLAISNIYFDTYDTCLIIYLFNQIRSTLNQHQIYQNIIIILSILQSFQNNIISNHLPLKQKFRKQNGVFSYMIPVIELYNQPFKQARAYFDQFQSTDPLKKAKIIKQIKKQNNQKLNQILNKINNTNFQQKFTYVNKAINQFQKNLDLQNSQQSQSQQQQRKEINSKKRKYFKILGNKQSSTAQSHTLTFNFQKIKRALNNTDDNDQQQLQFKDLIKKRQKIQNHLIPQVSRSKKELLQQKLFKKRTYR